MRKPLLACLALTLLPAAALAQVPRVTITGVRVGFTARDGQSHRSKAGLWAPVYVDVQAGNERLDAATYDLVVETTDSEDNQNVYVERRFLPTLEPKETAILLTYARPGSTGSEVTVNVRGRDGRLLAQRKAGRGEVDPLAPGLYLYLTLGGPIPSMKRVLAKRAVNPLLLEAAPEDDATEENESRRFAHVDQVAQMPTNWFGYQAADTVVLATGNEKFLEDLLRPDDQSTARVEALAEWVRRGGRLVVSAGHNHQLANGVLERLKVIDLKVRGQVPGQAQLRGLQNWAAANNAPFQAAPRPDKPGEPGALEVANLEPGPGVRVVATTQLGSGPPLIARAACGLGQVFVAGVDVDLPPFTSWKGQKEFWESVVRDLGVEPPGTGRAANAVQQRANPWMNQAQELATKLQDGLELFPDVPVISFGWVALFILVYILIVGPLDYFFLKKVVKRLELTWITFPTVVVVISGVAYFAAYKIKGNDLRVNKVDVLDLDLRGERAYGATWFTLFSPRIQNYTIGIEPNAAGGWGREPAPRGGGRNRPEDWAKDRYSPLVGWMGRPENLWGGSTRGGSGGLFRRAYAHAPEATGLEGVPIQVWSTKSFAASYERPIGPAEFIEADLRFTKENANKVGGRIVSHLPAPLEDVVLFYGGSGYNIGKLDPEQPLVLDVKNVVVNGQGDVAMNAWFGQGFVRPTVAQTSAPTRTRVYQGGQSAQPPGMLIKSILFHGHTADSSSSGVSNSTVRGLDQRWRLDRNNKDEVILFGRAVPPPNQTADGPAEAVNAGAVSPTRLWLGELPGRGQREPLAGTLSQETYVRVFIPVARQ